MNAAGLPWVVLLLALGCARREVPSDPPPASTEVAPVEATAGDPPPLSDPETLYTQCRERVESPEADGECASDADCVAAGCSGEVCLPKTAAEGLMTSCEVRLCYSVLQSCGCRAGRCAWTLGREKLDKKLVPRPGPKGE